MGIEEDTCQDEHWVWYVSDELWERIPNTKSTLYTLYVSQLDNKLYLKNLVKKKKNDSSSFLVFPTPFSWHTENGNICVS